MASALYNQLFCPRNFVDNNISPIANLQKIALPFIQKRLPHEFREAAKKDRDEYINKILAFLVALVCYS